MKQFFETYQDKPEFSALLRANTWSNNLHIISKTKTDEEKEFYLKLAAKEKYKARELEKQIDSGDITSVCSSPMGKRRQGFVIRKILA